MTTLVIAHLLGNALLLLTGYYWLGLGDSSGGLVLWSATVLLLAVTVALWLHGTALVFFRRRSTVMEAAAVAARNLPPLFLLAVTAAGVYWMLSYLDARFNHQAFLIGSYATMKTRKAVAPYSVLTGWHILIAIFQWLIVPVLLLPLAAAIAERGWSGIFLKSLKRVRSFFYWIGVAIPMATALYLPFRLIDWVPSLNSFTAQFTSFATRFLLAYLLFAGGLLTLEYVASRFSYHRNK